MAYTTFSHSPNPDFDWTSHAAQTVLANQALKSLCISAIASELAATIASAAATQIQHDGFRSVTSLPGSHGSRPGRYRPPTTCTSPSSLSRGNYVYDADIDTATEMFSWPSPVHSSAYQRNRPYPPYSLHRRTLASLDSLRNDPQISSLATCNGLVASVIDSIGEISERYPALAEEYERDPDSLLEQVAAWESFGHTDDSSYHQREDDFVRTTNATANSGFRDQEYLMSGAL